MFASFEIKYLSVYKINVPSYFSVLPPAFHAVHVEVVGRPIEHQVALLVVLCECHPGFSPPLSTLYFFSSSSPLKKTPQQRPEFELCLTAAAKFHFIKYVVVNVKGLELVLGVEALFHIVSPDPLSSKVSCPAIIRSR